MGIMKIITLQTKQGIKYENSFGLVAEYEEVPMEYTIRMGRFSSFELGSIPNAEHYAEGSLQINEAQLTDYDGVFSLPAEILYMLRHEGIDVSEMQESLEIKEEELQEAQRKLTFYQVDYDNQKEG
jgi:hypothetical protein